MKITDFNEFKKHYSLRRLVPVSAEILGDMDTPVSTFLKTMEGPYRFLLESVEGGAQRGRFSMLGDRPVAVFRSKAGHSELVDCLNGKMQSFTENPLNVLRQILSEYQFPSEEKEPGHTGGFFGYLGYDAVRYIEKMPETTVDDVQQDDIHMFIPQRMVVFDNLLNIIRFLHFSVPSGDVKKDYEAAVAAVKSRIKILHEAKLSNGTKPVEQVQSGFESNIDRDRFEQMVEKAKAHIKRGDIFQVVLSQRLSTRTDAKPFDIYRALRVVNPSPYMFYMEMDKVTLLGSSPETLVKLQNNRIIVKPIAGTRKRGLDDNEDNNLIKDLLSDPKEKAEHTMLVDLGRNDIGRVSKYGTVNVDEFMIIEKYSHVIHIVSTVSGQLKNGQNAVDVFRASFPAGTVSGAPKVRSMEIIDELEPTRRGIYAGAVGYFGFDGNMDVCIAIRTIYIQNGTAYLQAGAGIVADSVPANEYEETLNKARGLKRALEYAERGLI
ncbi:anthranilate synthase component I [candidate division KSB1 bacterium]|nr:anthranilate synthase component I [candidate division KSB1 bacterium]